jgi:hypothetical protein
MLSASCSFSSPCDQFAAAKGKPCGEGQALVFDKYQANIAIYLQEWGEYLMVKNYCRSLGFVRSAI